MLSDDLKRRLNLRPWSELSHFEQKSIKVALEAAELGSDWAPQMWWGYGTGPRSIAGFVCSNPHITV